MLGRFGRWDGPAYRRPLLAWSLTRCRGLQAGICLLVLLGALLRVVPVEMQKRIVNQAIAWSRTDLLLVYGGLYLAAALAASLVKFAVNWLQGLAGQRMLLEMRGELYRHILRLPLSFFRNTPSGLVVSSITGELAVVGEYLGQALAGPASSLLTLTAFAVYMFWLDPFLAAVSLVAFPAELLVLPWLQRRLNRLGRKRVDATRDLSGLIGEVVDGVREVRASGSHALESRRFDRLARRIHRLRLRMNLHNYGIKFINNFFQKLGPFAVFLVGGWLAAPGRLGLGELVAFLSALENLYDPWKDLMEHYQLYQDSQVRYRRVMSRFDAEPESVPEPGQGPPLRLSGAVEVRDLTFVAESGVPLLEDVSLDVKPGAPTALVGFSGSGKSTLALVLARLHGYRQGHVRLDGHELKDLSARDVAANIALVPQSPVIFSGTLRENLLYGVEALRLDGAPQPAAEDLERDVLDMVRRVGLAEDVLRFGLTTRIDPAARPDLAERAVAGRWRLWRERADDMAELVEPYDLDRYLRHVSVYQNILFGEPLAPEWRLEAAARSPDFEGFLRDVGLLPGLLELGARLVRPVAPLPPEFAEGGEQAFFETSPIRPEELPEYARLAGRLNGWPGGLDRTDRRLLLRLALRFTPARHVLISRPVALEQAVVAARSQFIRRFGGENAAGCGRMTSAGDAAAQEAARSGGVLFFCRGRYLPSRTLMENLLFGSPRLDRPDADRRATALVVSFLEDVGALDRVMTIGLDFEVGGKGERLSGGQKQKTAIARALLKKPRLLILDEATASLDNASQARIQRLLETDVKERCAVVAVIHRLDLAPGYDRIVVLQAGRVAEQGGYAELLARRGLFHRLAAGRGE